MIWPILAAAGVSTITPGSQLALDLRCVAAVLSATNLAKSEQDKSAMLMATLYFLGKVDGEALGLNLELAMIDTVTAPDFSKQIPDDMRRCGTELSGRGKVMADVGKALTERGF